MIVDNIKNIEKYGNIIPHFEKIKNFLKINDIKKLAPGKYEIDGKRVYAFLEVYNTMSENRWESHKKYIHILYILEGEEIIGYEPVENLTLKEEFWQEEDIGFYDDVSDATEVVLKKDSFAILFVGEGHRPCQSLNESVKVKKLVVKILSENIKV